jgi:hypothetical protein
MVIEAFADEHEAMQAGAEIESAKRRRR